MSAEEDLDIRLKATDAGAGRAIDRTWAQLNALNAEINKGNTAAQKWADENARAAERSAAAMSQAKAKIGTALLGIGLAGAAALGMSAKAAMDWETAWAGVNKTVEGTPAVMAELETGLRNLSKTLPASQEEVAGIAEAAGQLGVKTPGILAFTKTMIDLGVSTNLSADQAATSLAQMMNVMQTAPEDVSRMGATLVALGNAGASTESDILGMSQRMAAAGKIAGLSESDVMAFANAATSVGVGVEAGGSALSLFITKVKDAVLVGGGQLETIAEVAGVSADEFSRAYGEDAAGAIQMFVAGLGRMSESGSSATPVLKELGLNGIRTRQTLLSLATAGDLLTESLDLGRQAWQENSALVDEANKRYETTASKVAIAKNNLNDAAISVGETLLPVLASLAEGVANVAGGFSGLPGPVRMAITVTLGLVTATALLGGAYLKASAALVKNLELMKVAPGVISGVTTALKGVGIAAGIAAAAFAGIKLGQSVEEWTGARLSSDGLEAALVRLGGTGEATGPLLKTFGVNLRDLGKDLENAAHASWIDKGGPFGIGGNDFVDNIKNVDEALSNIVAQGDVDAAAAAFAYFAEKGDLASLSADELAKLFPQYTLAAENAAVASEQAATEQQKVAEAQERTTRTTQDLTPEQEILADAFGLSAEGASALTDGLDTLNETLSATFDQVFGLEDAQDGLQQKINDLTREIEGAATAFDDSGDPADRWSFSIDGASDSALRNRETLRSLVEYIGSDVIPQIVKHAGSEEEAAAKIDATRQALEDQLIALGYSREDVEKYTAALDVTPDLVSTLFEQVQMAESQAAADGLHSKYQALLGPDGDGWWTHVYADTDKAWSALTPFQQALAAWAATDTTKTVRIVYDESYYTGYTGSQDLNPPRPPAQGRDGGSDQRSGRYGGQSSQYGSESAYERGALAGTLTYPAGGYYYGAQGGGGYARQQADGEQSHVTIQMGDIFNPVASPAPSSAMRQVAQVASMGVSSGSNPPVYVLKENR